MRDEMNEYDRVAREVVLDWLDTEIEFSDVTERNDVYQMTEDGVEEVHRRAEIIRERLFAQFEAEVVEAHEVEEGEDFDGVGLVVTENGELGIVVPTEAPGNHWIVRVNDTTLRNLVAMIDAVLA